MRKLSLLLILSAVAASLLRADTVVEEIIARVNNQIITRSEYLRSEDQLRQELQQHDPSNAEKVFSDRDKDVLRDLIDQQLLLEKGKDLGISADTEVIKRLDQMRKDMHLDTMEDVEKAAQAQGVSFEDFKNNLRNQIITQQVIGKEVGSHLSVSKEDEQQYYDKHKPEMERPEEVRLSEILISTDKKGASDTRDTAQIVTDAKAKADDVLKQLHDGLSFDDLAKKESEGPSAQQGGDLGLFRRGALAKELEDQIFPLKEGDITGVIQTKQGFIILKVTEHHEAGLPSLADVEPRVQEALYVEKLQPALRAYLLKLREDAFIDIKPGYVDTGASPNETKPIETASKDPNAKQLKKKKKMGLF
jgi:peptidyl-prolyl cis-trans isomerase SurA